MKKALLTALILFFPVLVLFGELPANNPYALVSRSQEGDYTLYTLKTEGGFSFTVLERVAITESRMNGIRRMVGMITGFGTIKVGTARILVKEEATECFVTLSGLTYKEVDLTPYIPSGMAFYLTEQLRYDVTLVVKSQRIRVAGEYSTESRLVELLDRVVARPYEYLQMQDPEYLMNKFAEYDRRLAALQEVVLFMGNRRLFKLVTPMARETIETVILWKRDNPAFTVDDILAKGKEQGLDLKKKEVQLILIVYFREYPPEK